MEVDGGIIDIVFFIYGVLLNIGMKKVAYFVVYCNWEILSMVITRSIKR